jgi:hypothetical protein
MMQAQMADGTVLQFPEGTDPDVIKRVAKEYAAGKYRDPNAAGPPPQKPVEKPKTTTGMDAFVQGAVNSALLDWGDEAVGVIGGLAEGLGREEGFWKAYERTRDNTREWQKRAAQENPEEALAGTVTGAVASSVLPGGAIARGGSLAKNMLRAGAAGAAMGGVAGAGGAETMSEVPGAALKGAAIGGTIGAALPYAGNKVFGKDRLRSADEFKQVASRAYQQAEAAGATLSPQAFQRMSQTLVQKATDEGADEVAHPLIAAVLRRVTKDSTPQPGQLNVAPGFKNLEVYRRQINDALMSDDAGTRRIAGILKQEFDDFLDAVGPADIVAGNSRQATAAYKRARDMYYRASMVDLVDTVIERSKNRAGQYSQSGLENAIRTEMRQIAQNKRRLRQFSKSEQEIIRRGARGGSLENILRWVGKFNPKGVVSAAPAIALGMTVDPITGMVVGGTGYAASKGAEALTRRTLRRLEESARRGAPLRPYSPSGREAAITNVAPFLGAGLQTYKPAPAEVTVGRGDPDELRRLEGLLGR